MAITMPIPNKSHTSIEERWDWIVTFMVLEDLFVHEMLMIMEKRATTAIPSMAIGVDNASLILYYNPDFVKELDDPELRYVITHEIYHVAFHHCTTRRPEDPKQAGIWNKAFDLAINSIIPSSPQRHMPDGTYKGLLPKDFGFPEKLSAEQYIQLLRDKKDDGGDGEGGIYGITTKGDGKGDGKGDEKGSKSGKGKKGFDDHGQWREGEVMDEIIRNKIDQLSNREKVWGNMPGDIKSMILNAQRSQVKWHKILRHFIGLLPTTRQQSTFHKPHRRYGFPYCGSKRFHVDRKLVGIDTSGSISDSDLEQFLAEINRLSEVQPVDIQLFDHQLQGPIRPFSKKTAKYEFDGRGGTSFTPIMQLAEKKRYQSLIILTDGCAEAPTRPDFVKDIIWVLCDGGKAPVDWGRSVSIDTVVDTKK